MTPKQIKAIRQTLGLTQTQAAERVGITLRAWQQWEGGERRPSHRSVLLIELLRDKKI